MLYRGLAWQRLANVGRDHHCKCVFELAVDPHLGSCRCRCGFLTRLPALLPLESQGGRQSFSAGRA